MWCRRRRSSKVAKRQVIDVGPVSYQRFLLVACKCIGISVTPAPGRCRTPTVSLLDSHSNPEDSRPAMRLHSERRSAQARRPRKPCTLVGPTEISRYSACPRNAAASSRSTSTEAGRATDVSRLAMFTVDP
ncbi:hypothetical protein A8926_7310 [Saccharopolyspora spinosa]|uniref:Uncharacterized protein n=1 Tax=Saccharopolyspora spinosa TaxID=60894 RepID=A0A2N3Y8B6_SACSN|nr:hypothetical protein A8926_7310 [Saccharopolyspora spinosa]